MSFSQSTLVQLGNGSPRESFSLYNYKSDDLVVTVTDPGYFANSPRFNLQVNDVIYAQLGDGYFKLNMVDSTTAVLI